MAHLVQALRIQSWIKSAEKEDDKDGEKRKQKDHENDPSAALLRFGRFVPLWPFVTVPQLVLCRANRER